MFFVGMTKQSPNDFEDCFSRQVGIAMTFIFSNFFQ